MKFMATLAFRILIANSWTRWRGIFKGLSQDGEQADLCKNLRGSLFDKYLSNEPNSSRISLGSTFKNCWFGIEIKLGALKIEGKKRKSVKDALEDYSMHLWSYRLSSATCAGIE